MTLRKFEKNLSTILTAIGTIFYGWLLATSQANVRILEPPARHVLIALCFILPILLLITTIWEKQFLRGWITIFIAVVWSWITILYFIHPLNNTGWVSASMVVGHTLILLYRGRFNGNE